MGSGLAQDVRLSVRALLGSRLVSIVAVLTLALAVGANTAVFSLVNSLLLRPLPVADPDRLVSVSSDYAISHGFTAGAGWNYAMWDELRQRLDLFAGVLAWHGRRFTLGRSGETEPVNGLYASGEFFTTLGVRALHGRVFSADDDRRGGGSAGPVAVISHRLWQRRFGGGPNVVGTPLVVDGVPVTIIGVAPQTFLGLEVGQAFDVAVPIAAEPVIRGRDAAIFQPRNFLLLVMLRLKDGQSLQSATTTIRSLQPHIVPSSAPSFVQEPFRLVPAAGDASGPGAPQRIYKQPLLTMLAGVALVLLIACVNLANLLLARAAARQRDLSVRLALGASRWRLARPVMIESLVLAVTGALGGLALARWGASAMAALSSVVLDLSLDWRVGLFTTTIAMVTLLLVGLAPAVRATRGAPASALKGGGRSAAGGGPGRLSNALVVLQIALALVLVIAAGLLVRTFERLATLPLGFDADRVVVVNVDTARAEGDAARRLPLYERLAEAVAAVPGVERAAGSSWTPLSGEGVVFGIDVPGAPAGSEKVNVLANFVTPGWFSVYGTPLKEGRDVTDGDTAAAPRIVVVNEAFVRRFLPAGHAIGATTIDRQTIVGVVGDAVSRSAQQIPGVTSLALREPVPPTMYVPLAQASHWDRPPSTAIRISVRSRVDAPVTLAPSVGAALMAIDANLAFTFRPLAAYVSTALAQERMLAALSACFGALSLLLATLGLYGVMSYAVSLRHAEIGLRMALGATRSGVVRMILGRALSLIGLGILLGVGAAAMLTRWLSSMLFAVTPLDGATFIGLSLMLAAVGTIAALVPARRASRVDPNTALRGD